MLNGYPVLGTAEALAQYPHAGLLPTFDWPSTGDLPHERLNSLVDPSVVMSRTAQLGVGCVIYPQGFIGLHARLGDFVFCLSGCIINHDDVLGDHVTLASGVSLAGEVQIESGCYLGQACTVRQQVRIGQDSLIGMGAVIVKDVPANSVMAGNPAQRLRDRETTGS